MNEARVRASHDLVRERRRVGFLYREASADENDTGWRVFVDVQEQELVDDPDRVGVYRLAEIVAIDPSIEPLLDSPLYAAFCRDGSEEEFRTVLDFPVEPD